MYVLVNASPKMLDVATSFAGVYEMWRVLGIILCNHDPKDKIKSEKAGICDSVPPTVV